LGIIIAVPIRSAATTQAVATIGSSATIHPITPAPATAIMTSSVALAPPWPRRIASTKIRLVRTAWLAARMRLHDAPSALWERHTTTARTPQISHVPL
jgi:hypothetical protein